MLQLVNETGFAAAMFTSPDPEGIDSIYTAIKATFTLNGDVAPAEEQRGVVFSDEYHGDPGTSSIRVPADISLKKPGTDVLLTGSACAPGGRSVGQMDVELAVGPVRKIIRVFGDRYWESTGVGYAITSPAPFTQMPIVWERAFGGTDESSVGSPADTRNPVGVGFRAHDANYDLHGLPLPNLEDPNELITSWKQRPTPACFAPSSPHWEPRRSFVGTYDERWQQQRAPYLPQDFDPRFFQSAPPGLATRGYLQGGEPVEVRGVTPGRSLRFALPSHAIRVIHAVNGQREERIADLDTVLIDADKLELIMVWRSVFRCDKRMLSVRSVEAQLVNQA